MLLRYQKSWWPLIGIYLIAGWVSSGNDTSWWELGLVFILWAMLQWGFYSQAKVDLKQPLALLLIISQAGFLVTLGLALTKGPEISGVFRSLSLSFFLLSSILIFLGQQNRLFGHPHSYDASLATIFAALLVGAIVAGEKSSDFFRILPVHGYIFTSMLVGASRFQLMDVTEGEEEGEDGRKYFVRSCDYKEREAGMLKNFRAALVLPFGIVGVAFIILDGLGLILTLPQ